MDEINTGSPNVIDARGKSINRGVHNGIAFANFKAHKFSYLNITSLGTDYVLSEKECSFACVNIASCFSFNLAALDINGRILCELLPSDKYNNSDRFVSSQYFHHFSIAVSTSITAPLKCISIITLFLGKLLSSRSRKRRDLFFSAAMFKDDTNVLNITESDP